MKLLSIHVYWMIKSYISKKEKKETRRRKKRWGVGVGDGTHLLSTFNPRMASLKIFVHGCTCLPSKSSLPILPHFTTHPHTKNRQTIETTTLWAFYKVHFFQNTSNLQNFINNKNPFIIYKKIMKTCSPPLTNTCIGKYLLTHQCFFQGFQAWGQVYQI